MLDAQDLRITNGAVRSRPWRPPDSARRPSLTPLQRRLVGVGRALAIVAVVLCAVVLALGLARGEAVELTVVTAISLVVAAVPESLPAVVTLVLAPGSRRMAARAALIRRLPAVETLGSVTVLATDKTGTITEGRKAARVVWTPGGGEARIEGVGYAPAGAVRRAGVPLDAAGAPDISELLSAVVLCNDASLRPPDAGDGEWSALGDPTEAALLAAAERLGLDTEALRDANPRVAEIPFDSERRRMSTVHRLPGGSRLVCKGAPEVVLRPPLTDELADVIAEALDRAEAYAAEGLRVLAVAQGEAADGVGPEAAAARPGTRTNPLLPIAIAGALCLQLAGLYLPPLRELLGTQPLSALELAVVCGLSVLGYVAFKLDGLMLRHRRR